MRNGSIGPPPRPHLTGDGYDGASRKFRRKRKRPALAPAIERLLEELVDETRVRAAPGLLHDLPHEPSEGRGPALPVRGHLIRARRHHFGDRGPDRAFVRDLGEAIALDDGLRTLAAVPHLVENLLGDLSADRAGV